MQLPVPKLPRSQGRDKGRQRVPRVHPPRSGSRRSLRGWTRGNPFAPIPPARHFGCQNKMAYKLAQPPIGICCSASGWLLHHRGNVQLLLQIPSASSISRSTRQAAPIIARSAAASAFCPGIHKEIFSDYMDKLAGDKNVPESLLAGNATRPSLTCKAGSKEKLTQQFEAETTAPPGLTEVGCRSRFGNRHDFLPLGVYWRLLQ